MKCKSPLWLAMALSLFNQGATALTIELDYSLDTNNFFSNPTARALMDRAGEFFSERLNDSFDAYSSMRTINLPGGTATQVTIDSAADTLTVFVGGVNLGGSLGQGGASWSSTPNSRGEIGHRDDASATDFIPLWGTISFDLGADWYFDPDLSTSDDIGRNQSDFYSVALHELAHVLGVGIAPSWDRWINMNSFTGPNSTGVFGGDVPLQSGGGHWANGTTSTIDGQGVFETALDPSITDGTRKPFTDLDIAALRDIGWEVNQIPLPAGLWLFLSGLIALGRNLGRNT